MARRVLIVSPIPSHPQDQGNSARIHALGRALQQAGLLVHLLYWPMEGLAPAQRRAMEADWDGFHPFTPVRRSMAATGDGHFRIDDWYDPDLGPFAAALHRRFGFAAVLANYVWFSGVLEAFGPEVLKILDTHDVFADRDRRMIEAGLRAEWFWTRPDEEARGLARADIVLAIQDDEAAALAASGHRDIRVLGHPAPLRFRHPQPPRDRPVVGYLASTNPLNVGAFKRLRARLPRAPAGLDLVLAGAICERIADPAPFRALGRIDHLDSFYDQVDIVVNPMPSGTGLKIKSVEAVSEGLALIATAAAMTGLPARHRLHLLAGPEAVADALARLAPTPALLAGLAAASRACARAYAAAVAEAIAGLVAAIEGHSAAASRDSLLRRIRI